MLTILFGSVTTYQNLTTKWVVTSLMKYDTRWWYLFDNSEFKPTQFRKAKHTVVGSALFDGLSVLLLLTGSATGQLTLTPLTEHFKFLFQFYK